ncbi:MAG TPA: carbohydrate ABC transporter permease [Armatimonadota bacterium]|nr:carbohydrate ABC transporter permease [Armatimonadota bacterium]HOM70821.1 carbohydrate ABC transporter permease [Armatimonadota bacterium]HOP81163.1 carbohydrate ABC transporter permease [Armatimonadota bacterium]HPP73985.1 carbohydrate ABC transporter permease [Armatimonadota bacterium]
MAKKEASRNRARNRFIGPALTYLLLTAGAVIFALPFLWMISISLKEPAEVALPGLNLLPKKAIWANYPKALTIMPFHLYLLNTLKVTFLSVIGTLLSSSIAAYAFARLRAPGREVLFFVMLATIMLPAEVMMIPRFVIFRGLGWYDTLLPLIIPAFFGSAFYIFLIRQFFLTIPSDLEDAAKIDGCSAFRTYWQIFMPLSKPVLVTVAVFSFVAHWNDFMTPLIYLNSVEKRTLALGLATFQDVWGVDIVSLMAASTAVLIPVLVIFFLAQRYFVQGVVMSGIKG